MRRQDFRLRPVERKDWETVLQWRNLDSVRLMMFESEPISWDQHVKWMTSLAGNPHSHCLMFEYKGQPYGVVTAKLYRPEQRQWIWGCYLGRPGELRRGGAIMGMLALEYIFEQLGVENLIGEAVATNEHSLKFNDRLGFKRRGTFSQKTSTGQVVEAMLLVFPPGEWPKHKARLMRELFAEPVKP